ncbi:hypothetical protein H6G17_25910 [Chroococcidiopsis sp. FACHB-1243]|uniref:hypothetical protein n=1 Tax=Chroococcidiopsis sp. [FACHB-1243] TaxID=2692781 RepID=UPI00177E18C7|nr:hypothetical protein [Chroococcidiopsis sp. [FACHB-1243]]MBD2308907.1 hypothetical protein [Chroococcidiopsis sp. [FACHB-1243]]
MIISELNYLEVVSNNSILGGTRKPPKHSYPVSKKSNYAKLVQIQTGVNIAVFSKGNQSNTQNGSIRQS